MLVQVIDRLMKEPSVAERDVETILADAKEAEKLRQERDELKAKLAAVEQVDMQQMNKMWDKICEYCQAICHRPALLCPFMLG